MASQEELKKWWWSTVDEHWDNLIALIYRFHPGSNNPGTKYPITAPAAEQVCDIFRKEIDTKNPGDLAIKAKQERDGLTLWELFNET